MSDNNNNNSHKYWTSHLSTAKSTSSIINAAKCYSSNTSINTHLQQERERKSQQQIQQQQQQQYQLQLMFSQQARTRRSLSQLPTTANSSSLSINNNNSNLSIDNHYEPAKNNSYYKNSYLFAGSGCRVENSKSLDDYGEILSGGAGTQRVFNNNRKKFQLDTVSDFHSYENYAASERCLVKSNSPDYTITNEDLEKFNKVRSEDLNVDNSKWLEEKPLSVLQLDQPDRAVLKIAGKMLTSILVNKKSRRIPGKLISQ